MKMKVLMTTAALTTLAVVPLMAAPALAESHSEMESHTEGESHGMVEPKTISDQLDEIVLKQPPPEDVLEYPENVVHRQSVRLRAYTRELYDSQFRFAPPINTVDLPNPFAQSVSQQPGFYRATDTEPTPELYTDGQ